MSMKFATSETQVGGGGPSDDFGSNVSYVGKYMRRVRF